MAKFRSKLKRHQKGKIWTKGHSSTSNPENMKHRAKAKSQFFQPGLSLAFQTNETPQGIGLTMGTLSYHDARLAYAEEAKGPTISKVANSLKSSSLDGDTTESETVKTFQTFASNYSSCTNISFKKLLNGFRGNSELHKEMLAILTALTEIIRDRGGSQSSTEYFILLMETIEASKEDSETVAALALLVMGIKSVPKAVLRKKFSETAEVLIELIERFLESENLSVVKNIIGCLSALLRAQDYAAWTYPSTLKYVDIILTFTIHSKPKIRKAAQHAIISIMHGSSFMLSSTENDDQHNEDVKAQKLTAPKRKTHPAGAKVAKFCLNKLTPELITNSQTVVLYTLGLIRDTISVFKKEDIRTVCESILSIMTAPNVLLRTKCLQILHSLFLSRTNNLTNILCGKLLAAIYEYRPDKIDVLQTLAWITVLKEGYVHFASLDLTFCMNSLPVFFETCTSGLWISEKREVVTAVSNAIKEVIHECVKPACATQELAERYKVNLIKIMNLMTKVLSAPFGDIAKYIILTFAVMFEAAGEYLSDILKVPLALIGNRYDSESPLRVHTEHSIICAIKSMGPNKVLNILPLATPDNEIIVERSWLLPLLREGIQGGTFEFFANHILPLAQNCNKKWGEYSEKNTLSLAHTYELLCCQLWSLFPGFCRKPKDPENFHLIAKTLGYALAENPEFRAPILDGFIELIKECDDNCRNEVSKYAKNFLPRLFNIFATKVTTTYEADLRQKTLEAIKLFLTITSQSILHEFFDTSIQQIKSLSPGSFEWDALIDIVTQLIVYQNEADIKQFYNSIIVPVLKNEKSKVVSRDEQKLRKQQSGIYKLLNEILRGDKEGCQAFCNNNRISVQSLLFEAFNTNYAVCQAARLKCFKILLEKVKKASTKDELVIKSLQEAIIAFKKFSSKKESISQELVTIIAEIFLQNEKLDELIDIMMAGFGGDEILITNTILALRLIVQNQTGNLSVKTLEFILEQVIVFLVQKSRLKADVSVTFLLTFVKVLPSSLVSNYLEVIMKSLSAMVPDTKRYCRIQIGYLLKRLCKRFTAEELINLVPGNDEVTHRRLKKIRKQLRRENRKKQGQFTDGEEDSEEEFIGHLEKKSMTIDDILADSDSDLSGDEEETKVKPKKKAKQEEIHIKESPGEIVDLADVKSIGNIMTNHPGTWKSLKKKTNKPKNPNRGFKVAEDGRLVIIEKNIEDDSSESEDSYNSNKPKKRLLSDDSSEDEGKISALSRKRIAIDALSVTTSKSQVSNCKYIAGGQGIHRLATACVESGYSAQTGKSRVSAKAVDAEYSSKKAKGDIKKKGKLDPYAYIPLNRKFLNKRNVAKNLRRFKHILNNSQGTVSKGSRKRTRKN